VYNTFPKYEHITGISFTQGTFVSIIFKETAGAPLKKSGKGKTSIGGTADVIV
jgi:hypothetical protein